MSPRRRRSSRQTFGLFTVGAVALIGLSVYLFTRQQRLPTYWVWLVTLSVVTFFWYGFGRRQGTRSGGRWPEVMLHLLALAGGFPGGWLGLLIFRAPRRQTSFLVIVILSTVLHVGLAPQLLTL